MTLSPENSTFAQTKYMTNLSTILKKNVVIIRKHLKRKTASLEEEPKKILSSASKHLMYVFTSHHSLQTKIKDLFKTYNKDRNKSSQCGNTKTNLEYKEETFTEEQEDHGIGSNMTEQGMNIGYSQGTIIFNVCFSECNTSHIDRNIKHTKLQHCREGDTTLQHCTEEDTTLQHYREEDSPDWNCGTQYIVPNRI